MFNLHHQANLRPSSSSDIDPGVRPLRLPPSGGRVRVRPSPKLLHQVSSRAVVAPGPVPDWLGLLTGERGEMQTEFTFVEQPAGGTVPATEPDPALVALAVDALDGVLPCS